MSNKYNNLQEDNAQSSAHRTRPRIFTKKKVITFFLVIVIALFGVVDIFVDPPAWWRFERQQDKKAILEYVESNYPDNIKRKGGKFPLQMPAGPFEDSVMCFELDSVDFTISAQDGKVKHDTYYEAKAEKYICENFIDSFMNERGISPEIKIWFIHSPNNHGKIRDDSLDDIYSFGGTIHVTITQAHIYDVTTPKEVGWFYDFYKYWMEKCDLNNCTVYMHYRQNNDYSTNESDYVVWFMREKKEFSTEKDFYDNFVT